VRGQGVGPEQRVRPSDAGAVPEGQVTGITDPHNSCWLKLFAHAHVEIAMRRRQSLLL
jgi:hypothetical protein